MYRINLILLLLLLIFYNILLLYFLILVQIITVPSIPIRRNTLSTQSQYNQI